MPLPRGVPSLLIVLAIFLVLGAGIGWRLLSEEPETGTTRPELPETEGVDVESASLFAGPNPVQGAEVLRDTLWIQVVATGEATAFRRSRVATRTSGTVGRVFVKEGDVVEAGQILIQLDTTEAALNLEEARATLATRRIDYEAQMLAGDDAAESDSARAERERHVRANSGLEQAEFNLERARREMEWTEVRARFGGVVADLAAVEGAFLSSGGEALTLVQVDPIKIEVDVLESDLAHLRPGRRASVFFPALAHDPPSTARVMSINPIVERERGGSARVTLQMPNPEHRIYPGMFARVSVDARWYEDRVMVPREAITEREGGGNRRQVVFVARNLDEDGVGITEWRYVTIGFRNQTHVEIVPNEATSMVEAGEIVLVDGHQQIAHDIPIRLVDNVRAAGGVPGGR